MLNVSFYLSQHWRTLAPPRWSDRTLTNDVCTRPDCPGYGLLFVIESFIGRRARRKGDKWDFLVKWEGMYVCSLSDVASISNGCYHRVFNR